ncbi:hypothetical protein BDQ12DRAFT_693140 [Crucibulum laeve]|uniref:Rad52/22 family double-strand break repair protein-domain-containing protein n=1 Tax=Crucibulum laeve TaxID=68775 RepID=A0A5C3LJD7_9AGAR|nr:hypothetical protein BDQ12DRAFT_693140 [Crucibulum laeve]
MAGAFSGHLLNSYGAFSSMNQSFGSSLTTSGNVSFDPRMHGTPAPFGQQSFSFFGSEASFAEGISDATAAKIASLQVKLDQKLGPEYISQRPGPGGGSKLVYVEGWKVINLANEVFGFNGWSSNVVSLTTDFLDYNEETRRYNVGVTAIMRVTLRDGVCHEDIGYGMLENSKGKGAALDKCKKEAVTDGLKRALRNFGNLLGNCLYDKSYTQEIVKIKIPPPKFDRTELHRRPEFEETKPNIASTSTSMPNSHSMPPPKLPMQPNNANQTPNRPPQGQDQSNQSKPLTSLPPHMRNEVYTSGSGSADSSSISPASNLSTSYVQSANAKGKAPERQQQLTGLNTPIATSRHPQPPQCRPPQQQPQQVDRKVTFAEPPQQKPPPLAAPSAQAASKTECESDDSFHFYSDDDDAFLAAIDLGEGNLSQIIGESVADRGRPIQEEDAGGRSIEDEDMGPPIHFDNADETSPDNGGNTSIGVPVRGGVTTSADTSASGSTSSSSRSAARMNAISAALNASSTTPPNPNNSGSATGILSRLLPQQPQQHHQRLSNPPSNGFSANQGTGPRQAQSRPQQISNSNLNQQSIALQQNHGSSENQPKAGGNRPENCTAMPSGGFQFPPGREHAMKSGPPNTGVGIKRPAETMGSSSASSNYRGSRPGMGLQQAVAAGPGREILGQRDVGEGGDTKRVRL